MVKRYLFFSLFLFSCIAALTCDARQGDHLTRLMKAKKAKKIDNKSGFHVQAVELAEALIPQEGSKAIDKIQRLPGQLSNVNFTQYGGYVTIDEQAGRALYYYFAEVDGADPSSKPLVLWLNGGNNLHDHELYCTIDLRFEIYIHLRGFFFFFIFKAVRIMLLALLNMGP